MAGSFAALRRDVSQRDRRRAAPRPLTTSAPRSRPAASPSRIRSSSAGTATPSTPGGTGSTRWPKMTAKPGSTHWRHRCPTAPFLPSSATRTTGIRSVNRSQFGRCRMCKRYRNTEPHVFEFIIHRPSTRTLGQRPSRLGGEVERALHVQAQALAAGPGDHRRIVGAQFGRRRHQPRAKP